mmetsp:Transcript_17320/g.35695  ORF Transcript_17320/g.35695 Transcript_17320/m.35695 type:complete len:229 (+) Transcript_17320:1679-2365(+)
MLGNDSGPLLWSCARELVKNCKRMVEGILGNLFAGPLRIKELEVNQFARGDDEVATLTVLEGFNLFFLVKANLDQPATWLEQPVNFVEQLLCRFVAISVAHRRVYKTLVNDVIKVPIIELLKVQAISNHPLDIRETLPLLLDNYLRVVHVHRVRVSALVMKFRREGCIPTAHDQDCLLRLRIADKRRDCALKLIPSTHPIERLITGSIRIVAVIPVRLISVLGHSTLY